MVNIDSDLYFVYIMSLTFEKKYYKKVSSLDLIYAFFSLEHSNRQDTCSLNLRGVLEGHMNCYRLTNWPQSSESVNSFYLFFISLSYSFT